MKKFRIWKTDGSTETIEANKIEIIRKKLSMDLKFKKENKTVKISNVIILTEICELIVVSKSQIESSNEDDD